MTRARILTGLEILRRVEIASRANRIGRMSRNVGAPHLSSQSDAIQVAAWLQWCDPNGSHTADRARAEDCEPYTDDRAWEALESMVNE